MIITYNGIVRTHASMSVHNDSLFILGHMYSTKTIEPPLEILIEPTLKFNAGRFANSGNDQFPSNSSSILGLFRDPHHDAIQIVVYIYAKQFISAGTEVLYDYGDSYSLIQTQEKNQ